MYEKLKIDNIVAIVMLCTAIVFSLGCGIKGGQEGVAKPVSGPIKPPQTLGNKPLDTAMVRFSGQPVETPEPGSVGIFVDELHAWVTDELQAKDGKRSGGLARTIDGGQTWMRLSPSSKPNAPDWLPYDYLQVRFVSSTRGWMSGNDSTWQTDDGGDIWRQIFAASFADLRFADDQSGWMNLADLSGQQTYLTKDGGQTWQPCGSKRTYSQQVPGDKSYFLTPQVAWAVTSKAHKKDPRSTVKGVAKSTDGGCNWIQLWINDNADVRYHDIYFLNENEGWLGGEKTLLHTMDGGKSWSEIHRPIEEMNTLHVYFVNSKEGWISGGYPFMPAEDTGVYRTTNGGETWRQVSDREIVAGFDENGRRVEVPEKWKAGKLMQMLYAKAKGRNK